LNKAQLLIQFFPLLAPISVESTSLPRAIRIRAELKKLVEAGFEVLPYLWLLPVFLPFSGGDIRNQHHVGIHENERDPATPFAGGHAFPAEFEQILGRT